MSFKKKAVIAIIAAVIGISLIPIETTETVETVETVETNSTSPSTTVIPVTDSEVTLNTNAISHSFAEWKDPKTGLIWLKCAIGEELVNGFCTQVKAYPGSIHEKIRSVTDNLTSGRSQLYTPGSLYEAKDTRGSGMAEIKYTYDQTQEVLNYLNSQNFNGSNNWRLPTVSELASLRHCYKGWTYMSDAIIPEGDTSISVRQKCEIYSSAEQIEFYNSLNSLSPMRPGYYGHLQNEIPYWAWTANFDIYNDSSQVFIVNPIFGKIRTIKLEGGSIGDFGNAVYIFLVRDR